MALGGPNIVRRTIILIESAKADMPVAALYDIHANLSALEAVLEDLRKTEVDRIIVGGDVLPSPMPCARSETETPSMGSGNGSDGAANELASPFTT